MPIEFYDKGIKVFVGQEELHIAIVVGSAPLSEAIPPPVYPESAESTNFPKDEPTGVPRHEATYEPIHMKIESQSLLSSHDFHTLWCGWPPT